MGNNPSRPAGAHSRSRSTSRFQTQDRAFPKRSFTTPARGKYDRYDYEDDEDGRESEYLASRAPHNPFQSPMPAHQMGGYYVREFFFFFAGVSRGSLAVVGLPRVKSVGDS